MDFFCTKNILLLKALHLNLNVVDIWGWASGDLGKKITRT